MEDQHNMAEGGACPYVYYCWHVLLRHSACVWQSEPTIPFRVLLNHCNNNVRPTIDWVNTNVGMYTDTIRDADLFFVVRGIPRPIWTGLSVDECSIVTRYYLKLTFPRKGKGSLIRIPKTDKTESSVFSRTFSLDFVVFRTCDPSNVERAHRVYCTYKNQITLTDWSLYLRNDGT